MIFIEILPIKSSLQLQECMVVRWSQIVKISAILTFKYNRRQFGIQIQKVRELNLFKFTDELQSRLEIFIERKNNNTLTQKETAELAGIRELDRIFTLLKARIIADV